MQILQSMSSDHSRTIPEITNRKTGAQAQNNWRSCNKLPKNKWTEETSKETFKILQTKYQYVCNAVKAMLRGKFIAFNALGIKE